METVGELQQDSIFHDQSREEPRSLKRSRSKMEAYTPTSGPRTPTASNTVAYTLPESTTSNSSPSSSASVTSLPSRFPGDGMDYRRPIVSPTSAAIQNNHSRRLESPFRSQQFNQIPTVIDLTGSDDAEPDSRSGLPPPPPPPHIYNTQASRPPRFSAEVINLDDSPPSFSRTLPRPNPPHRPPRRPRSPTPIPPATTSDDEDVELLYERPVEYPRHPPIFVPPFFQQEGLRRDRSIGSNSIERRLSSHSQTRRPSDMQYATRIRTHVSRAMQSTASRLSQIQMPLWDFTAVGFSMGFVASSVPVNSPPPPDRPTHAELPPARDGFTRSLNEEDELICPNCKQELGTGEEDLKRQVSVVKGCGHVYCGECAPKIRRKPKGKSVEKPRAGPRPKPITKCIVEGCEQKAGSRDVIHVFL